MKSTQRPKTYERINMWNLNMSASAEWMLISLYCCFSVRLCVCVFFVSIFEISFCVFTISKFTVENGLFRAKATLSTEQSKRWAVCAQYIRSLDSLFGVLHPDRDDNGYTYYLYRAVPHHSHPLFFTSTSTHTQTQNTNVIDPTGRKYTVENKYTYQTYDYNRCFVLLFLGIIHAWINILLCKVHKYINV